MTKNYEKHENRLNRSTSNFYTGKNALSSANIDLNMRALTLMLWRRKLVIIGIMLIGLSLMALAVHILPPRYTANSLILFESNQNKQALNDLHILASFMKYDNALIMSEIEVIRARTTLDRVVEKLNLVNDPEFNSAKDLVQKPQNIFANTFKTLNLQNEEHENITPTAEQPNTEAISKLLSNLQVVSLRGTFALEIQYTSTNPQKAALIANTLADTYIELRLERKFKTAKKMTDWLDKRLTELRQQVRASEEAVVSYKKKFGITEGTKSALSTEEITQINAQLINSKTKEAEIEARLKQLRNLSSNPNNIENATTVLESPFIQELKKNEALLSQELSELQTRYGDKHPRIIKLKAEIKDQQQQMRLEIAKVIKGVSYELDIARSQVMALEEQMHKSSGEKFIENEAMIKLRELEREAASNQLIFDTFLETYKKTDRQEELQDAEARIISYAIEPQAPTFPNKMLMMSLATIVSLFIGFTFSFFLEKLDNTFRSANQLESYLGYPCLSLIPIVNRFGKKRPADYVLQNPSSMVAEAIRTLRTVLKLRFPDDIRSSKVVMVTSSVPGEGKSTLSCWIGRLAAKSGEKVILIDADLRRPTIHNALGKNNSLSLVEYLIGKNKLEEIIDKNDPAGLHVIYGRAVPNSALDLVGSVKMDNLIATLRKSYDLIIIDSPACLAVSDSRLLAKSADQTLFVVNWDKTPREVVASGIKQFYDMKYDNVAFVLTNVNVKKHVSFGYGDTAYYYGHSESYT